MADVTRAPFAAIGAAELAARLGRPGAPAILDVRSATEFASGHVPGAAHLPFWRVLLGARPAAPRHRTLVVYCGLGPRARMAAFALRRRGFTDVRFLDGHWAAWRSAGLPADAPGPR